MLKNKIKTILVNRHIVLFATLLGLLISLPGLTNGLCMDDYQQRTTLLTDASGNPFEFYRMGTPQTEAMLQSGILPWWTHPDSKLVFFRPIAKWLMQFDYWLWPDNIVLMHLHSVLWYAVLIVAVGFTYRKFMPTQLAVGLAVVMFAIDAAHGSAVAWVANRNALVAMAGSMAALLCYRQSQWYWQWLGCVLFALTMACAEAALAITGYFFAYEIFLSERRWHQRILRLLPYALIALGWLWFWRYQGYGSAGPGFYTDPGSDPGKFLQDSIYRIPAYLIGQFLLLIPVEILAVLENTPWRAHAFIGVVIIFAIIAKFLWPLLCSSPLARFYALGMLIATIPICGSQLVGRSLWYVGFGAIGLLALLFERFSIFADKRPQQKSMAVFAGIMLALHFAVSPLLYLIGSKASVLLDHYMDSRTVQLPNAEGGEKNVLAISAYAYETNTYYPMLKDQALSLGNAPTRPHPSISRLRLLTNGSNEFELSRETEDTLVVRSDNGFRAMREGKYGFNIGDQVVLDDVIINVRAVSAEREPVEIEFRFRPGALKTYQIIAWDKNKFAPAKLPEVGAKAVYKTLSA